MLLEHSFGGYKCNVGDPVSVREKQDIPQIDISPSLVDL